MEKNASSSQKPGGINATVARISSVTSTIAILTILCGAMVVLADVLVRWLAGSAITALNELMSHVFAVAVAATLPAGAARRINLKVELLSPFISARLNGWLTFAGSFLMALFFGVLAWQIWGLAERFHASGRITSLLAWPLAPTYYFGAVSMAAAAAFQLANAWQDLRNLRGAASHGARRTSVPVMLLFTLTAVLVLTGLVWALVDIRSLSRIAMSSPLLFAVIAFGMLWLGVLAQLPLAAVSGFVGLAGTVLYVGGGSAANVFATDTMEFLTNPLVATLPLFLTMGSCAVAAGISEDIYRLANAILGRIRGGLAYATIAGCAAFGAVTGSSVATAATFGRIALPEMKRRNYAPSLSSGVVAAGGTLGALVPPSGPIILFALLTEASIGVLFIAAIIPAVIAVLLYFAAIAAVARLRPDAIPAHDAKAEPILPALGRAAPVIVLFALVLGGLYGGVFTVTESAAVGAVGAFLMALLRGKLNRASFVNIVSEITATTAMIYGLIFGALIFSFYINLGQGPDIVVRWIVELDARPILILTVLLIFYLLLGCVMDSFAIMVITVPVVTPLVIGLGYDINHWGILMLVIVEIGMITPPFGLNLFVLNGLQPDVPLAQVMRGAIPFVLADVVKIVLLVLIPALSLWLPSTMGTN